MPEHNDGPRPAADKRPWKDRLSRLYRPGPLCVLFAALLFGLGVLAYVLATRSPAPPQPAPQAPETQAPRAYEEDLPPDIADKVRQADYALIDTLHVLKLTARPELLDVQVRRLDSRDYHFQVVQIPLRENRERFLAEFAASVSRRVGQAELVEVERNVFALSIDGVVTHRIILDLGPPAPPSPLVPGGRLAIVIDDMGEDVGIARGLARLPVAVSFSVWPLASSAKTVALLAEKAGRELLVHLPMEPKAYPRANPGPGALFVSMTGEEIGRLVREALDRLPTARGLNNHMGSRFTESGPGMHAALVPLRERGLFFLDSVTSYQSAAQTQAQALGVPFHRRDVFLDNVRDVRAILHQLRLAQRLALKRGHAVAIGHPHPETLQALSIWAREMNGAVAVVPVSALPTD